MRNLRVAHFSAGVLLIHAAKDLHEGQAVLCETVEGWTPAMILSVDEGTTGLIAVAESTGSVWTLRHDREAGWIVVERVPMLAREAA